MKSSDHWYDLTGKSCHRTIGKNGKERASTIRDAKENNWLPSVTSVLGILAKPQLEDWKFRQITAAAWNLNAFAADANNVNLWHEKVMDAAFQKVDDAADLGTSIHQAIEDHFQGRPIGNDMLPYITCVDQWVKTEGVRFCEHEIRLVSQKHGYAGTTDAVVESKHGLAIIDFKSRKSKPEYPMTPWDGQAMQIAAYAKAKGAKVGANVFISTTEPGRIEATWYDESTIEAEWMAFLNVLALWKHLKRYDPTAALLTQ
jgi:hypothetical protein